MDSQSFQAVESHMMSIMNQEWINVHFDHQAKAEKNFVITHALSISDYIELVFNIYFLFIS